MANRTLTFGAKGPEVKQLQQGLNRLPSALPRLDEDGDYGGRTTARVKEFQTRSGLAADGVTGPLTWQKFLELLAQVAQGGLPPMPKAAHDALRPLVLAVAQQHLGMVDFSVRIAGKPKGLDFLIQMFQYAAGAKLTDANFRDPKSGDWIWTPWVGLPTQRKSWCGIFAVYCYKKAGIPVSWDMGRGGPVGPIRLNSFSSSFVSNIRQADIGCVATQSHHFLIESVQGGGPLPALSTIDGNTDWGRIERRSPTNPKGHKVGKDNFNYYSLS
jgi:hypothetical protein